MKLAIVAFPALDEDDREGIESFRGRHDPQASRISLHFTLVFPFNAEPDRIMSEVAAAARSMGPIPFTIRQTSVVRDTVGGGAWKVFLVPDEGWAQVARLHDRLYSGSLKGSLREDIPFAPHITVGAAADAQLAQEWAKTLEVPPRVIAGTLASIDVVDVGEHRVRSVASYRFGESEGTTGE